MGLAVFIGAKVVPGVAINGFGSAVLAAVLIAVANATVGLILRIFTFPINFLTLGLMSFVISVLMIMLVDHFMADFYTKNFFAAAIFAIVVAIVNALYSLVAGSDKD